MSPLPYSSTARNMLQGIKNRAVADVLDHEAQFLHRLSSKAESDAERPNLNDSTRSYFKGVAQGYRLSAEELSNDAARIRTLTSEPASSP